MPVYLIADIEVVDAELYAEYVARVPEVIHRYGGQYLVRGGNAATLSGDWVPERIILVEFETVERLQECFGSTEYSELAPLRKQSTISRSIVVEGYGSPE